MSTDAQGTFDLTQQQESLSVFFEGEEHVVFAYLFGSYARGTANPLSDVDIAVLLDQELDKHQRFDCRLDLIHELNLLLHVNDTDVAVLNDAPLALAYRVFRDGVLLFSRSEAMRIAFQADIVSRYLDFKPFLERYERALLERARRGELLRGYDPHRGAFERHRQLRKSADGAR